MEIIEGKLRAIEGKKIAIVSTRWNHFVVDRLVEGAKDAFLRHGGEETNLTHVLAPGAFELPMVVQKLLESGKYDGVCA
ncbi:MAG: 6,7-dimethyl-8-ribityllumazine synthase, partial [Sulfurimonas sp.]